MDKNEGKPDMLEQAGELIRRFSKVEAIGSTLYTDRNAAIVIASAVLAVAGELRDIHNVLDEINGRMAADGERADLYASAAVWGTGS